MRVLMIGLGDIAHKAYLPVLAAHASVELHLVTRNPEVLAAAGSVYRIPHLYSGLDEALAAGRFEAAFVHAATSAHVAIVDALLSMNIAVFVDKPLAPSYDQAAALVDKAERLGVPLFVAFNRRFAPAYASLRGVPHDTLVMHKHRRQPAGDIRQTIFDDFIHVVDTLRFFSPAAEQRITIETTVRQGKLHAVLLSLASAEHKALGLMNRQAGLDEERLELVGPGGRRAVLNLSDTIDYDGAEVLRRRGDWSSVSMQRGFDAMCAAFLEAVRDHHPVQSQDILETHRLCEHIVCHAEANAA